MAASLKPWFDLEGAAKHLAAALNITAEAADVLRLALDGEFTLSVHVVDGTFARLWQKRENVLGAATSQGAASITYPGWGTLARTQKIIYLQADMVWDLPLVGAERFVALQYHQQLRGLPDSQDGLMALAGLAGPWFIAGPDGALYQPQRHRGADNPDNPNLHPQWLHPDNFADFSLNGEYPFVIRTPAIHEYLRRENRSSFTHADSLAAEPPRMASVEVIGVDMGGVSSARVQEPGLAQSVNKHIPKLERQKFAILQWLNENNYTPHNLPKRSPGKSGPKAEVKRAMLKDRYLFTESSFRKAWESLRSDKLIQGD